MQDLTPAKRADLRAYWMIQHGTEGSRALLSGPADYGALLSVLQISRGVDPSKQPKKSTNSRALASRIAQHSGVSVERVLAGLGEKG